jgi:hypothetical protein
MTGGFDHMAAETANDTARKIEAQITMCRGSLSSRMAGLNLVTGIFISLVIVVDGAAQGASNSLSGVVSRREGGVVPNAPIRLRNAEGDVDAKIRSSTSGSYEFSSLPAGRYVLSVNMPCCEFLPYVREDIELAGGASTVIDILLPSGDLHVEGDDPGQTNDHILRAQRVEHGPVPLTADGRPDFSGVWLTSGDPYPERVPLKAWAREVVQARVANGFAEHPRAFCLPGSPPVPGLSDSIAKFVQTSDLLVMLFEEVPGYRQVFLDGRTVPTSLNPSWMGHSFGRWDADTLVVETMGFNAQGWTEVFPRSEKLRMRERYRRADYSTMEVEVTFDDPDVFDRAWSRTMRWTLAPQEELIEYVCENNRYAPAQ